MMMMFGADVDFILTVAVLRSPHRKRFCIRLQLLAASTDEIYKPFFIFWMWIMLLLLLLYRCRCRLAIVIGHRRLRSLCNWELHHRRSCCSLATVILVAQR